MVTQNRVNNVATTAQGAQPLSGVKYVNAFCNSINGDVDAYTVPAGKRACITQTLFCAPTGPVTIYAQIKVSGVYYKIGNTVTLTAAASSASASPQIVLEAGQSISIHANATGANAWWDVLEFDSTSNLKSSIVINPSTGNNTIYTVPVGKTAIVLQSAVTTRSINSGGMLYRNESGGNVTLTIYVVPSGGSIGTTTEFNTQSVGTATLINQTLTGTLTAGDSIVYNVSVGTTTQLAWVNILEM
jgi:hypothetical protein